MASRARNLANLLGGGEVTVPATKIADIPASKLSDEISTIEQVSDIDALTATGNTVGDQRVVGNNLYIWNGSGWFRIALINETPTWDSGGQPAGAYVLDADSPQDATVITLAASDPDGFPISYSYVTAGSMDSMATISQDSSVFTITPKTITELEEGVELTGSITFRASDGVNILPSVSSFTLEFITVIENNKYTTLLATAVDTSDNNNITDSSTNNHTITVNADAHAGTFSPYRHGGYSLYNTGTNHIQTSGLTAPGTGDYTIEAWVYVTNNSSDCVIWDTRFISQDGTSGAYVIFRTNNTLRFGTGGTTYFTTTSTYNTNEWLHVALVRDGSTASLYVNGVLGGSTSNSTNWNSGDVNIGSNRSGASVFNGYIRDLRIANEVVYSGAFTPPTASLTATGGEYSDTTNVNTSLTTTQLLTCHLPYLADGSSNDHSITVTGSVETKPFGPYDHNEYSESNNGGSVAFEAGDYLTVPDSDDWNFGSGDFTIEFWAYPTNWGSNGIICAVNQWASPGSGFNRAWVVFVGPSHLQLSYSTDGSNQQDITSSSPPVLNSWVHVAITRSGNTVRIFKDGILTGSSDIGSTTFNNSNAVLAINGETGSTYGRGDINIADLRIVKGTAVYTSAFTPPTTPQSSSGTALHIKGTDASIIDKSQTSNLQLFGNTTGSTTQVKFANTKSMYFDGSTDYLLAPASSGFAFGTGDFTVELWAYPISPPTNYDAKFVGTHYFSPTDSDRGWGFSYRTDGTIIFYMLGSTGSGEVFHPSMSALTTNTWHHLAATRSGTDLRIFLNGTAILTGTSTYNEDLVATLKIGTGWATNLGSGGYSGYKYNGYMYDIRVTKGLARYTANFTSPTAPLKG